MRNAIIQNVNIQNVKFRMQEETAKNRSEGLKVSRFQIWGDKIIWQMSIFEMRGQGKTAKIWDVAFKVSRPQGFKFKFTKQHGKYQHSKC